LKTREILNSILANATGQPLEKIERDADRDYIMDAQKAMEYGMIDRVINKRELPGTTPVHSERPLNGSGR
jgi:ATP-dependent Clp protease, protease subunit